MKKIYYLIILCTGVTLSCKKQGDLHQNPAQAEYEVNFSLSQFSQSSSTLASKSSTLSEQGDTLANYVDYLFCNIYNTSGILVTAINQSSDMPQFGVISERLAPGSYTAVFSASKHKTAFVNAEQLNTLGLPNDASGQFFKVHNFSVQSEALNQSVRLERLGGAIEVNIEDAIPEKTTTIEVIATNDIAIYRLNGNHVYARAIRFIVIDGDDIGEQNKKIFMHVLNTVTPFQLKIRAYDKNTARVFAEKIVENLWCYRNKQTMLTGKLFPTSSVSGEFSISINSNWDSPPPAGVF